MSFASSLLQSIKDFVNSQQNRKVLYIFGGGLALLLAYSKFSKKSRPQRKITWKAESEEEIFDVAIIGAGPSGATMGWYLAQESINGKKVKVVCFDKQKFPRDKICGDAVTTLAQKHLKRMGIIKELVEEDQCHWAQTGGFVSPSGYSFIGNSAKELNRGDEGAVVAIKRIVMDDKIVKAAVKAGVNLRELTKVVDASFDTDTGLWKIKCVDENEKELPVYRARMLVAADGSTSTFARKKGLVKSEPDGTCSRAFVTGEYNFQWDGVVFYPRALLPGYAAIMRHAKNELVYCVYIIPGNPNCKNEHLTDFHHKLLEEDPFISKAIGPKANPRVSFERMKAASLRLGGLKGSERSYDDHFLVIGDAAGFIDPLTGEGIQYAMESGEIGAKIVREGLRNKNLGASFLKQYQDVWYRDWGREFYWSLKVAYLLYKMPIMLDAAAKLIEKRGAKFLADWAEVMTGSQSKMWFLRPDVWSLIVLEAIGIGFRKLFMPHTLPKPN